MLKYFRNKKWLIDQINEYRDRTMRNIQTIHDLHEVNKKIRKDYDVLIVDYNALSQDCGAYKRENMELQAKYICLMDDFKNTFNNAVNYYKEKESLQDENTKLKFRTNYSNSQEIVIQELEAKNKLLNEKNLKLSGDIGKAFSDICDLHNVIEELQAENLGLLNRIANEPQSHDPDLKIDLTKPIRYKSDGGLSIKPKMDFVNVKANEPLSIKNIVPKKETLPDVNKLVWVNDGQDMIKPTIVKNNDYTVIDMTNKSKAVRAFFQKELCVGNLSVPFRYDKRQNVFPALNQFCEIDYDMYNLTSDNVRKILKDWVENGFVIRTDVSYVAAKPIKIMLEKEK